MKGQNGLPIGAAVVIFQNWHLEKFRLFPSFLLTSYMKLNKVRHGNHIPIRSKAHKCTLIGWMLLMNKLHGFKCIESVCTRMLSWILESSNDKLGIEKEAIRLKWFIMMMLELWLDNDDEVKAHLCTTMGAKLF